MAHPKDTLRRGNRIPYRLSENPLDTVFSQRHFIAPDFPFSSEGFLCSCFLGLTPLSDPPLSHWTTLVSTSQSSVLCSSAGRLQARLASLAFYFHWLPLPPPRSSKGQPVFYSPIVGHLSGLQILIIIKWLCVLMYKNLGGHMLLFLLDGYLEENTCTLPVVIYSFQ